MGIKKYLVSLLVVFAFMFVFAPRNLPVFADGEFVVDANVAYTFNEKGVAEVVHNFSLENLFSNLYATSYTLQLENVSAYDIKATEEGTPLQFEEVQDGDQILIKVLFVEGKVGKGAVRNFTVSFKADDFSTRTGEVWEISIPKLGESESFRNYNATVNVPKTFGLLSYVSPNFITHNETASSNSYTFSKESVLAFGISAGFGNFQSFSFTLNYHLENPITKSQEVSIPVPPDTAFQKVFLENITPTPTKIDLDNDGNWLASFNLKPRERLDVKVNGSVQIFSDPRFTTPLSQEQFTTYTSPSEFWQTDASAIMSLAQTLQGPQSIYDWVVNNLDYDYERVRPNTKRLGAEAALLAKTSAICTEFTDVFIALARAKGIPAREINGFAYTENPDIQPLSLVADVLHAWPEYYDTGKQVWVPVDPTWGDTTGGVDYFTKLDLRHFAFVIHATDPQKPYPPGSFKLGPNPQKDVFVNFGKLPEKRTPTISIVAKNSASIPISKSKVVVTVSNTGPVAAYNLVPIVYFDDTEMELESISHLLPFTTSEFEFLVPTSFLGLKTPATVKVQLLDQEFEIAGYKERVLTNTLIILGVALILIIIGVFAFLNKARIKKFLNRANTQATNTHSKQN